jgi:hypothetical protein
VSAVAAARGRTYAATARGSIHCWDERGEAREGVPAADGAVSLLAASPDGATAAYVALGHVSRLDPAGRVDRVGFDADDAPVALWWARDGEVAWFGRQGRLYRWTYEGVALEPQRFEPLPHGAQPWVLKPARDRLMEAEARFGLMLSGLEVVPVPPERFEERASRHEPWSE